VGAAVEGREGLFYVARHADVEALLEEPELEHGALFGVEVEQPRMREQPAMSRLNVFDDDLERLSTFIALAQQIHRLKNPLLLVEALGDRRLILFVAILGRAVDLDFIGARAIVLEPEGDRLWLALRAAALDRPTIARIALALADADPRRDIDIFAEELDAIAAVPVEAARSALAPLTLHHDLRLAIDALAREAGR
jgi:hypothetical protein